MYRKPYSEKEKDEILAALDANGGNVSLTAKQHEIAYSTLREWVKAQREQAGADDAPAGASAGADDVPAGASAGADDEELPDDVFAELEDELSKKALKLTRSLLDALEKAPLNQRASATGAVIDRLLKVAAYREHLVEIADGPADADPDAKDDHGPDQIEFVFRYPDGSTSDVPPWELWEAQEREYEGD